MTHAWRWTAEKIARRLELIEPLVYRRQRSLPPFQYQALPSSGEIDEAAWSSLYSTVSRAVRSQSRRPARSP